MRVLELSNFDEGWRATFEAETPREVVRIHELLNLPFHPATRVLVILSNEELEMVQPGDASPSEQLPIGV